VTHLLPLLSAAGLTLVGSLACASSRPGEPALDRDFEVAGGSSARVDDTDLVIRFEAVPNDSRCPVDVQCITAGDATVALRLEGGGAEAQTIELHTLDGPNEAAHGGYVVALVILRPRPVSTRPTPLGKYRATLRVRRSASMPVPQLAGSARDCGPFWGASAADAAAIRGVAQAWKDAYNAGDSARVASLYAEDGQYLSAHVAARGREAIQAYFQRGIAGGGHIDAVTVLDSGSDGTLAYAAGTYAANNAGQKVDGRILLVLRRCEDAWLIVAHEVVVRDQP
jgi:uncharacterized protein (TIGR02246 family)